MPSEKASMPKPVFRALKEITTPDGKYWEVGDIVEGIPNADINWMREQGCIQDPNAPWSPVSAGEPVSAPESALEPFNGSETATDTPSA